MFYFTSLLIYAQSLSQLLNVHNVRDVRQIEVHMAEQLVPGPSRLEVKTGIAKLKKYMMFLQWSEV
jgi:hypothetical protein